MLYMNESKPETNERPEQDDLFGYSDMTPPAAPPDDSLADLEVEREPMEGGMTPETLPLIQETLTPPPAEAPVVPKKAPLIFSAHAPIPTRGEPEEEDTRRKRIIEQTSREIPPLTMEQVPTDYTLGQVLVMARENAAYTVEMVSDITRISSIAITSLEDNDLKRLPPYIYQTAYLRELCKLYKLPQETCDFIQQLHGRLHKEHETHARLPDAELNCSDEERRANWIFTGIMAGIGLVIILAIWAVVVALVKHNGEKEAYEQQVMETPPAVQPRSTPVSFDQKKLEKLAPERMLDIRTLEMGKTHKVSE